MTENKRFTLIDGVKKGTHSGIWDNQKQHNMGIGDELWIGEVVAMLNEGITLAEENKELKKESYGNLDGLETYKALYLDLSEKFSNLEADYDDLKKENEQLKQQIQQLQHWNKCLAQKRHQELSYKSYNTSESEKKRKELLEPKLFNCSDR